MDIKFNINNYVKVKLTEEGFSILRDKHNKLNEMIVNAGGQGFGEFNPKIDKEGYYRCQMWCLMSDFGEYIRMGIINPFDCEIILSIKD